MHMQMKCGALPSVPYTVISKNVVADATRDSEITEAIKYYSHKYGGGTGLIFDAEDNSSAHFPNKKSFETSDFETNIFIALLVFTHTIDRVSRAR